MKYSLKTNAIYCGDCKNILAQFPEKSVDLIYVDPPFFTSKNYEIVFKDGYEIRSFQDAHWYADGKRREDIFVYLDWLKEWVEECHRILKDTGTFYLHCDWHANAYIRVYVLDKIFKGGFKNEIIWCYAGGGIPKKDFPRKHDLIFRYTKSDRCVFNPEYRPYTEGTIQRGRTEVKGKYAEKGLRPEGTPINDWWTDINPIHSPTDPEKLGYPTQKPEALLERIVRISSNPGDIVLDPMCGCGTTLVAAHRLRRGWIGIDISPTGCKLMRERLRNNFDELKVNPPEIFGLPMTSEELREISWADFQNWVCEKIGGKSAEKKVRDGGIDGWTFPERIPIFVRQSESVGRPAVDNFESAIRRYYSGSRKEMKGIMIAFSFTSDAYEEVSRVKFENEIQIDLKTVKEILEEE